MIPSTVYFTGLDFDPAALIKGRKHRGPIPPAWLRVRFIVENDFSLTRIDQWLAKSFDHAFASYIISLSHNKRVVVIAFENDTDAVLFKLKDGEHAWAEQADEVS